MVDKLEDVMLGSRARTGQPEPTLVGTYVGEIKKLEPGLVWFTIPTWDRGQHLFGPVRLAGTALSGTTVAGTVTGGSTVTGSVQVGATVGSSCLVLLPGGDQEPWILGWR